MDSSFFHIFYLRGSKKESAASIYLRVTINGKRAAMSLNRKILVDSWNSSAGRASGNSLEAKLLNRYLSKVENDLFKAHQKLLEKKEIFSANDLVNTLLGKDTPSKEPKMLLQIFQEHNERVNKLIGKDFAAGTAERYRTAKKHVEDYIKKEYKASDIPVKDVDHKFISGLEYYLKTERNFAHNSAIKYITNFKKIIRIAYANEWIDRDPFNNWKGKLKIVDREFLTQDELQLMIEKEIRNDRLNLVKDIFLFCCFTGLAYADVKKLSEKEVVVGIDGNKWIKMNRTKTKTRSSIPILPTAEAILQKYTSHPDVNHKRLLPVLSNQKMNAYIKEIGDLCGINKNLTFHLARHTFATTVTLSNGVPIESVSKMLGHKNLQTTQHYAKILDRKISDDMAALRERLGSNIPTMN
ncbi:site-specific integrase [Salinimicrobium tongyeongense]|uniref:Site-specific integrase n=1 Tax=Salinimicrobium tongyeongense TaxID=2809707 RepID=A0ABY6NRD8_9FLAO|nr:site-specific integrase [Salinimicrobium tongyeongense]UZH55476.1 site-specific integrase [Salinimicrobium tongyeongense]